ncbi:MAG: 4Fe-4S dicluster domain-containing protein, partial [Proteobacteria bacterium]|nr:4Fe-4S dicluster domain-containing protein [Pseudomonadota bacterium]
MEDSPLFIRDYNLCIGCGRCVRACRELRGVEAIGLICHNGEFLVGTVGPSLKESGCMFCSACVEVCPTGALRDRDLEWPVPKEDIVPCRHACPVNIDIPRYIHLISEGKSVEAAAVIRERVPFPLVLGYVCHRPCERSCRRGKLDEALSIGALKRFAAERDSELLKIRHTK